MKSFTIPPDSPLPLVSPTEAQKIAFAKAMIERGLEEWDRRLAEDAYKTGGPK